MEKGNGWRRGEAEIETRPAFGSVKEAVALFEEKILAGEMYATRLRETDKETKPTPSPQSRLRSLTFELEQTKQTLTRTVQLNISLSNEIKSLTKELEHERKKEIQWLTRTTSSRGLNNPEELKFVEEHQTITTKDVEEEFEKKRLVTFASSPLLTRVMSSVKVEEERKKKEEDSGRDFMVKKTKSKKGFGPFMRWVRASTRGGE